MLYPCLVTTAHECGISNLNSIKNWYQHPLFPAQNSMECRAYPSLSIPMTMCLSDRIDVNLYELKPIEIAKQAPQQWHGTATSSIVGNLRRYLALFNAHSLAQAILKDVLSQKVCLSTNFSAYCVWSKVGFCQLFCRSRFRVVLYFILNLNWKLLLLHLA